MTTNTAWWAAEKGRVHATVIDYVRTVDRQQSYIFDRFRKLEALYDPERAQGRTGSFGAGPNSLLDPRSALRAKRAEGRMIENIVSQNINTLASQIATMDVRATFDTDGADWSEQRRAKEREWYAEELKTKNDVIPKCAHAFKVGTALKGTGVVKVYADRFDQLCVKPIRIDNIVVDERAYPDGDPQDLHYREPYDSARLQAEFPKFRKEIEAAKGTGLGTVQRWAGWLPMMRSDVLVIESWRLPIGDPKHENYVPGRHTITISGADLLDEEWNKPGYPFAFHFYERPPTGWYGIGMGEELAGHQRALNKRNSQIDRQIDHNAHPIIAVPRIDAKLAAQTVNTLGTIAVYDGRQPPQITFGQAVSQDLLASRADIKVSSFEQTGLSRLAANSTKPAGIETGVALREYRDQTTQRFASQEKGFETFVLDVITLMLDVCKDLGGKAPEMIRRSKFGRRRLSWARVSMDDIRCQIGAASTLSRTRAGRLQLVVELAQAGIIGQDESRRLLRHPDIEREISLYTAAIESADEVLEQIADGNIVTPEPFMNLKMLQWRGQQQYLIWRGLKAPEEILENLRQMIAIAAWLDKRGRQGAANGELPAAPSSAEVIGPPQGGMPGGAPPMMPGLPPGGAVPPMEQQLVA